MDRFLKMIFNLVFSLSPGIDRTSTALPSLLRQFRAVRDSWRLPYNEDGIRKALKRDIIDY